MPDAPGPDPATAVLPGLPIAGWQARIAMLEVTALRLPGPAARGRFAVRGAGLDLTGSTDVDLRLRADGPERGPAEVAYRALLGRPGHDDERPAGLALHCTAGRGRRLTGELVVNGLAREVSLRVRLLDVRTDRVLLWLSGPVHLPSPDRRIPHPSPHIQLAAEFTR
jgi:hypothetical protein